MSVPQETHARILAQPTRISVWFIADRLLSRHFQNVETRSKQAEHIKRPCSALQAGVWFICFFGLWNGRVHKQDEGVE